MTPCRPDGEPDFDHLVSTAKDLIRGGMRAVVYCGSMGDWPLLEDRQRQTGVERLVEAGIPVIAGTGAVNSQAAAAHATHAKKSGAQGLMLIPRVLSRGTSPAAQKAHFAAILEAGEGLPSIIYNSPYYGFETRAELFFDLRSQFPNLVGFKEFGGADALDYAAEHITNEQPELVLVVGVDTQVRHGYLRCGAGGAITGIGNVLPREVLHLISLCQRAVDGDGEARRLAGELDQTLAPLAQFDASPDLVLYYKYLMAESGQPGYERHFIAADTLSESQKNFARHHFNAFRLWWDNWPGKSL